MTAGAAKLKARVDRMINGRDREKNLETQVKILADRLALALMAQHQVMHAVVLSPDREDDRELLRVDSEYDKFLRMVRRMLTTEMQRQRLEDQSE